MSENEKLKPGAVVAERFRLERQLGQGGMGSVWLAQHLGLDVHCAVKFLKLEAAASADMRQRFEREAKAAARLKSANVVQILDHGVWEDTPYIAMEYLEGEDLNHRLKRVRRLDPRDLVRITTHVSRALTKAHAAGLVHRDLKPSNIFLVRDDEQEIAKVLDFGVAKRQAGEQSPGEQETRSGSLLGTPHYMSPEQAQGTRVVDHRSDLWSLAVVVFQCMTGQLPFRSDALGDLLVQIIVHEPPVPSTVSSVPPTFDAWWARAVARDPSDRFQSAKELAVALAMALGVTARRDRLGGEFSGPWPPSGFRLDRAAGRERRADDAALDRPDAHADLEHRAAAVERHEQLGADGEPQRAVGLDRPDAAPLAEVDRGDGVDRRHRDRRRRRRLRAGLQDRRHRVVFGLRPRRRHPRRGRPRPRAGRTCIRSKRRRGRAAEGDAGAPPTGRGPAVTAVMLRRPSPSRPHPAESQAEAPGSRSRQVTSARTSGSEMKRVALALCASVLASGVGGRERGAERERTFARPNARLRGQEALDHKDYATGGARASSRPTGSFTRRRCLLGLARAQAGLDKLIIAKATYQRIVDEGVPARSPQPWFRALEDAKSELALLKQSRIPPALRDQVSPARARERVTLDGSAINPSEPAAADPGKHTLRATADGFAPAEAVVDAREGDATATREARASAGR